MEFFNERVQSGKKRFIRTIRHRFPSLENIEHKGNQKKPSYARVEKTRAQKLVTVPEKRRKNEKAKRLRRR